MIDQTTRRLLVAGPLLALVTLAPLHAIVVDSSADTTVAGDGSCTLREAINNVNGGADTTGGDCATGNNVTFDASTDGVPIVLTGASGDDLNLSGDLDVLADATITGNGPTLTIVSGGGIDRVFDLKFTADSVTLQQLEIRDGNGLGSSGDGGGVRCNAAVNTMLDCRIVDNDSGDTGGGVGNGGDPNRQIYIERCEISGNNAADDGGGIGTHGSGADMILEVVDSVIDGNTAAKQGGGIFRSASSGTTRITRTTISENTSLEVSDSNGGGGLSYNSNSGRLEIVDSVVRGNIAMGTGGGLLLDGFSSTVLVSGSTISGNSADFSGGGIASRDGAEADFVNTTVSGNSSALSGGGYWVRHPGLVVSLANVTMSDNTADADSNGSGDGGGIFLEDGQVLMGSSILGGNIDSGGEGPDCDPAGLGIESLGYNLVQADADCNLSGDTGTNITGVGPGLEPLANYGGPTETHLPSAGSPVIDAGSCAVSGATEDARDFARPFDVPLVPDVDDGCDIGSLEWTDADADGAEDGIDNCLGLSNPDQADDDFDGVGDACDLCEGDDATGDGDADGICADRDCDDGDGMGISCWIFGDGFELGDASPWSSSVP